MNRVANLIGIDVLHALAWSLLHSIWQAGLVAILLLCISSFTKSQQASLRSHWYGLGMFTCLIFSALTFAHYFGNGPLKLNFGLSTATNISTYIPISSDANWVTQLSSLINRHLLQIVLAWCLGFFIVWLRQMWNWRCNHILLKSHTEDLPQLWQVKLSSLAKKLNLHQCIGFRVTYKLSVPCVIGYLKPVLLLPASVLLGMSPQQIEVIVLHELAHIRRHDLLIAHVQNTIKAVYFFNPFVLWISAQLDQERENACDDIAVGVCGNPLLYAKTLEYFAEMHAHFSINIAMTGRKNMLKHRIQRLFATDVRSVRPVKRSISTLLLMSLAFTSVSYAWVSNDNANNISLQAKNLSLKQLLQQAEKACDGTMPKIALRQADMVVNVNFSNISCHDVPALFVDMQERFGMRFNDVKFQAALDIFKQQCPTVFRDIRLKNPNALYSVNMLDVSCVEILNAVAEFDANVK